jgi:hypothetical protein
MESRVHEAGRKLYAYITSGLGPWKFWALDFWCRVCVILHNTESYHQVVYQKIATDELDPTYARVYTLYTAETPSKYASVKVQYNLQWSSTQITLRISYENVN